MLKLPEKKYEPKHNKELNRYAIGWNSIIEDVKFLCNAYGDEYARKKVLRKKETALERWVSPFKVYFKGQYDCIIEIERLNNEEPEHRLDNFFKDSLEALDNLTIKSDDELDKKLEELNKYNEDSQLRML